MRQVTDSPSLDTDQPVSIQHEMEYLRHYGYAFYWSGDGWSPAVLRRRRALAGDTDRVGLYRVEWQRRLEAQIVHPSVPEIVLVHESFESA